MNDNGSAGDDLTDEWRDELLDAPERAALPKWDEAQARLWLEQAWFNELSEMAQIIAADLTRWLKKSYWNHSPLDWDPRAHAERELLFAFREAREHFVPGKGSLRGYLYRIAQNALKDLFITQGSTHCCSVRTAYRHIGEENVGRADAHRAKSHARVINQTDAVAEGCISQGGKRRCGRAPGSRQRTPELKHLEAPEPQEERAIYTLEDFYEVCRDQADRDVIDGIYNDGEKHRSIQEAARALGLVRRDVTERASLIALRFCLKHGYPFQLDEPGEKNRTMDNLVANCVSIELGEEIEELDPHRELPKPAGDPLAGAETPLATAC